MKRLLIKAIVDGLVCLVALLAAPGFWPLWLVPVLCGLGWLFELRRSSEVQVPEQAVEIPPQEAAPLQLAEPQPADEANPVPLPRNDRAGKGFSLRWLGGEFAVARLDPGRGVPPWAAELLDCSHEALELRLAFSEMPAGSAGLACDPAVSKQKRRKEEWSRLVWLGLSPGELTLVAPWWLIRDRQAQVQARRDNPGPRTRKGEALPQLSAEYASLLAVQGPWVALCVDGVLDFGLTGVLSSLAEPLALSGISIFVLSSWNTDFVLVAADQAAAAEACLKAAGHRFL